VSTFLLNLEHFVAPQGVFFPRNAYHLRFAEQQNIYATMAFSETKCFSYRAAVAFLAPGAVSYRPRLIGFWLFFLLGYAKGGRVGLQVSL
jgi:hypothetical protein